MSDHTREFDCANCGNHVVSFGRIAANDQGLCVECAWCRENGLVRFICPRCDRRSFNLNDARERYCGACHLFFDEAGNVTF